MPRAGSSRRRMPTAKASRASSSRGRGTSSSRLGRRAGGQVPSARRPTGNWEGDERAVASCDRSPSVAAESARIRPSSPPRSRTPASALRGAGGAGPAGDRRQGPDRVERAGDRGVRRGGPGVRRARVRRAPRSVAPTSFEAPARRPRTAPALMAGRVRGGPGSPTTTPLVASACLTLYETTRRRVVRAGARARRRAHQAVPRRGARRVLPDGLRRRALILRPKELYDNAVPSGNSVAAEVLLRIASSPASAEREDRRVGDPLVRDVLAAGADGVRAGAVGARPVARSEPRDRHRWRSGRRRHPRARRGGRSRSLPTERGHRHGRTLRRGGDGTRWRSFATARRWTASRPRTCVSASPVASP